MTPLSGFPYELLYWERALTSVAHSTREDVEAFLALAERTALRVEVETFPMEEAREALRRVKDARLRGSAVLVQRRSTS